MYRHMPKLLALAASLALIVTACSKGGRNAAHNSAPPAKPATTARQPATAASAVSKASGAPVFDVAELDRNISPCQNLNGFVNAKWVKANPIPADQVIWGSFSELREKSLDDQHALVEQAAKNADSARSGSIEQKIGWLFSSAMNMTARDKAGFDPIKPDLASIDAIRSRRQLQPWLDSNFAKGDGKIFGFGSGADFKNAKQQIAYTDQSGLGLPTPDYYSKPRYRKIRDAYVKYLANLFQMTGASAAAAHAQAELSLKFESALARHSVPRVEMRKPENQYHFVSVAEANRITPHFDWATFFKSQGVTVTRGFSLSQPGFFREFDRLLAHAPLAEWKAYLKARTISGAANALSQPFVDARFDFYGKTLTGQPKRKPRWKYALGSVNGAMGQALGQLYVKKYFPPMAKKRADVLVRNILQAFKGRIERVTWMSEATRQKALKKLSMILPKIGYPGHWRSWAGLKIRKDDYYANMEAAAKFNYDYDIAKIGKPTNRQEWSMSPQTVNAYYSSTTNTINFPAAILQPPFFYAHGDDAINYGGIGAVIGHESTHGFDDHGSQYDGHGNLHNWWTRADRKQFDAHAEKLVEQFDAYAPLQDHPKLHVNGKLTLGENIADLGGLNIAYDALQMALKNNPAEANRKIDGYTEDQRFFMSWARVWRGKVREKTEMLLLNVDPHSPMKYRADGPPSNMPAFARAFQCKAGDRMVRPAGKRVKIW